MLCLIAQFCLTLCDPMGCSHPGSSVSGILQAKILKWVAMSFSNFGEYQNPRLETSLCYAQVTKSPNDHQGADIQCKSMTVFITKLKLGLPLLLMQRLRRGASNSGLHYLCRVFSSEKNWKTDFQVGRRLISYFLWKG